MSGLEVSRVGDSVSTGHPCDGTTTLDTPGQNKVFAEGLLVCRLTDRTVSHNILVGGICIPHTAPINGSSDKVYVAGKKVARRTDGCDSGSITSGSSKVFVG